MSINQKKSRTGFTLVELLVVIAIIGILIGMLLPAVQMVRESARKASCQNNLKQLGIAFTHYHDSKGRIPPARATDNSVSWVVFMMPYLEQRNLYETLSPRNAYIDQDPDAVQTPLTVINCPSRRSSMLSEYETNGSPIGICGDYAGNAGTSEFFPYDVWAKFTEPVDGVFNSGYAKDNPVAGNQLTTGEKGRYKFKDITDGQSNTIFIGEKAVNRLTMGKPGGWGDGCIYNGDEPGTIMRLGGYGMDMATNQEFGAPGPGAIPVFGSAHPQLANFVFGDGSVHTLRNEIDTETFRRLCSRKDGSPVTLD